MAFPAAFALQVSYPSGSHRTCCSRRRMHHRVVCTSAVLWGRGPKAPIGNMVYHRRMVYLRRSEKGRGDACVAPTPGLAAALLIPPPRAPGYALSTSASLSAPSAPPIRVANKCITDWCVSAVLWGRGPQAQTGNMVYSRPAGKGRGDACVAPTPGPSAALLIPHLPACVGYCGIYLHKCVVCGHLPRVCGLLDSHPIMTVIGGPPPPRAYALSMSVSLSADLYHFRRAFFVPNRPSRDPREPVLEVSGEDTQSLESGASGHRARPGRDGKGGGPGAPGDPEARLPIPPPRACARGIVHICIIIRGEFCLPKQLSKDMREPFPEALDMTRNVGKAALAAIERDTAWLERRMSPGADAPLPTSLRLPAASRQPASHCA